MSPAKRRRIAGESGPGGASRPTAPSQPAAEPAEEIVDEVVEAPEVAEAVETVEAPVEEPDVQMDEPTPALPPKKPTVPSARKKAPSAAPVAKEPSTGPTSLVTVIARVLAVALLAAGAFAFYWGWQKAHEGGPGDEPLDAAKIGIQTIFTYDYQELDEHKKESVKLMTASYAEEFKKILPNAVEKGAAEKQAVAQAIWRAAATMPCGVDCSPDKANVLVFYDQASQVAGEETPVLKPQRAVLKLVKQDGEWKINGIDAIN